MNKANHLFVLFSFVAASFMNLKTVQAEQHRRELPKWEVGAGFGYVGFEHYPASNQVTHLALPFPTFQYRGDVLRADDREGAKVFLLKEHGWDLQLGGLGFPPLNSSGNEARQGMADLPAVGALGPQLQKSLNEDLTLKFGVYQAVAATWLALRGAGGIWEVSLSYQKTYDFRGRSAFWDLDETSCTVSLNLMGASKELHEIYFSVPAENVTNDRPAYEAQAGLLQSQVSYFQSFKRGHFAFYVGARYSDYRLSANRSSPLHKTDHSLAGLLGITYTFYQSKEAAVSPDDATGAIEKLRGRK